MAPGLTVQLTDRVVLSPFAANRMAVLLQNVIRDYEWRYGELDIGTADPMRRIIMQGLLQLGEAAAAGAFTLGRFLAVKEAPVS